MPKLPKPLLTEIHHRFMRLDVLDLRVVDRISFHFYSKELESLNRDLEMVFDVTWHTKSRFWAEVEFGSKIMTML